TDYEISSPSPFLRTEGKGDCPSLSPLTAGTAHFELLQACRPGSQPPHPHLASPRGRRPISSLSSRRASPEPHCGMCPTSMPPSGRTLNGSSRQGSWSTRSKREL